MAIALMSHIRLIGLRAQQNKILDVLTEKGMFEVRSTDDVPVELCREKSSNHREFKRKQDKIVFALGFLKARHSAMQNMLLAHKKDEDGFYSYELSGEKYKDARTLIGKDDFSDVRAKEYDLLSVCDTLEKISFELVETESRLTALKNKAAEYAPFSRSPLTLSTLGTHGKVSVTLYVSSQKGNVEKALDGLTCAYDVNASGNALVTVVCRTEDEAEIDKALGAIGYQKCAFRDECTAAQKISDIKAQCEATEKEIFNITEKALGYEKYVKELKILYDVIGLEIERAEAEGGFLKTDDTFVLEGWLPEAYAEKTVEEIKKVCPNTFIQLLAPEEKDEPPTLVQSNKVVEPYESITNLYSPPKYREIDPNPIMAIFYFLFFGIMIGDAAYGLILAVVGLIAGLSKKFDKGVKSVILLVAMGGISAIIWGVLFGGYFAIDFGANKVALWFNPLEEPMTLLILSIVLGCVQLVVGYIIKFVRLCMEGKPFSAIFDAGSIIILFGALGCLASTMLFDNVPKGVMTAAIVLAIIGLALIIIFGGRKNKKIFGKVFGGLTGVYGLVNLLSDILSYCRLFGLGLASCAIGFAFNTLGGMILSIGPAGYIPGAIVLVVFHAFNIGIGVLGAYVHNARLQFLEFYGKFYDGGGRLFEPLGSRTKYIRFE
ncbi:MAG: V-type ATP synthase subunit I [Clostridiales bacterium]|nr:V-type ATP synthase subunit I [Clostridiales bacterium]